MKILVVAAPLPGRLRPMLPVVAALRDAGHSVRVVGVGPAVGGIPVVDVSHGLHVRRIVVEVAARHPAAALQERSGRAGTAFVAEVHGRVSAAVVDTVVELALTWRPDLVVHEPLAVAAAVAAARLGVPAVVHETGLADGREQIASVVRCPALRARMHRWGLDELPEPALVLSLAPPSLVGLRRAVVLRCAPSSSSGGADAPTWLCRPSAPPRIVVCGGGADRRWTHPGRTVARAAAALDAEVVLVAAPGRTAWQALPGTVRRTGPVALADVLPHATALVHDGGAFEVLAALTAGVPQLVVPGPGECRANAELVAARHAGLAVSAPGVTPELLSHLVRDPGLRTTAQAVHRELAGMPAARDVVRDLVALVGVR